MSKSKTNKCRHVWSNGSGHYEPWFRKRRAKNRIRNKMQKASRKINRGQR